MVINLRSISLSMFSVLMLYSCEGKDTKKAEKKAPSQKVSVQAIQLTDQTQNLTYSGSIEADNSVSIGFNVPGRVVSVNVQEGQRISRGQLLAVIEQNTYSNALAVANAGLEQAQDNFKRLDQLYKKQSLPERDYIAAKTSLAQAKANRESAVKNLQDTRLFASFSGIVSQKLSEAGGYAAPGVPIFNIVKIDNVYATASVTENEISTLRVGTPVEITIPSLNKKLNGHITIINPQADNLSKTYMVKVRLSNPGGQLMPGMIADLNISTGKSVPSVIIPAQAVIRDPDNVSYVYLAKSNNTAFKKRVEITGTAGSSEVIISNGLKQGDRLIVEGQTKLSDGSKISY
ncbi:efflux RND transporter periplasmic adaptor subunit [Chryseobacterium populi]|uniref:RND family efflux transporter, MFP subunit n=1 Tax=Chryseobacterium populi TaxID=1144316 RepID=J2K667_9FLAO|nr:efflux RND transporter periplasmic adaptor subunit [Chryseobacterium populi]EJL68718.1 RND family efflux transporter, MFP subunit [Chryseobacterium populi]